MTTQTKPHDRLTAAERHELPDSAFGIPETREFPLVDAEHVRAATCTMALGSDDPGKTSAPHVRLVGLNPRSTLSHSVAVPSMGFT